MSPRVIDYTVAIARPIYFMDWVIIRGPRYWMSFSELNFMGEAEYVLGIF